MYNTHRTHFVTIKEHIEIKNEHCHSITDLEHINMTWDALLSKL